MFTNWRGFLLSCLLLILVLTIGIVKQDGIKSKPPVTTTTTTTIQWNEKNLNLLIEQISKEENFGNVYLLKELAYHESRYLTYDKILDTNKYYSYGLYHFQLYTFLEQAEKYNVIPTGTTLDEGRILIMNPELQLRTICRMDLAMIRKKWYNSWNKIYCN